MPCKACRCENMQKLEGELTASFAGLNGVQLAPVYVCESVLVCLECGFAELIVPKSELELVKKGKAALGS
jgi:hypothetical protein